ncbi:MAG: hypothetical protein ACK559_28805 [bacterium]
MQALTHLVDTPGIRMQILVVQMAAAVLLLAGLGLQQRLSLGHQQPPLRTACRIAASACH